MQVGQLYRHLRDRFRAAELPTPELDAKFLTSGALGLTVSDVLLAELEEASPQGVSNALAFMERRLQGVPVGRILGERDFYGRVFQLNAETLEPRPDTEVLVDAVLERIPDEKSLTMCDVGTGSGAIAVSLLCEMSSLRIIGVDISELALDCAVGNAERHGVKDRFFPVVGDFCASLKPGLDWIVSNPPYIRTSVMTELDAEVLHHDPEKALDGGTDGLDAYRAIISQSACLLLPKGHIAFEIGYDQAADVEELLINYDFEGIEVISDLSGQHRVVVARRK